VLGLAKIALKEKDFEHFAETATVFFFLDVGK
jgi:hypothetical protein